MSNFFIDKNKEDKITAISRSLLLDYRGRIKKDLMNSNFRISKN